jgi:hypothetical protein
MRVCSDGSPLGESWELFEGNKKTAGGLRRRFFDFGVVWIRFGLVEASQGVLDTEGKECTETEVQDFFARFVSKDEDISGLHKDSFTWIDVGFC